MPTKPAVAVLFLLTLLARPAQEPADRNEALWNAARDGDRARVAALLDAGVDVNARTRYGATALSFAADKGHLDVVRLLVERGADVNSRDTFYRIRPLDMAISGGHLDVAQYLLERGSGGAAAALTAAIRASNVGLVKAALAGPDLDPPALASAAALASQANHEEIAALVTAASAARPVEAPKVIDVPEAVLARYVGTYRNEGAGVTATVSLRAGRLVVDGPGLSLRLVPTGDATFAAEQSAFTVTFAGRGSLVERMTVSQRSGGLSLERASPESTAAPPAPDPPAPADVARATSERVAPRPWPSFRGPDAGGVADGQEAVADWDPASGRHIRWKTPVPGLATSSPIVWGDRVFLTTAVGSRADDRFRTGLYGDVSPVEDLSEHTWKVLALDARTGAVVWERSVFTGKPGVKRHPKSSQASSTPVTDGRRVVSLFGTIGLLVCHDVEGTELWRADVGVLDSGWFFDPTYQWGHSSSPIIYGDTVIVQADVQRGSFLAAYDLASGRERWRTPRDEISTWGTPTIVRGSGRDELVTNGPTIRGYDPRSGTLLWTLGPNSEITVGTPVAGAGLVYVTGGYPPVRPVYAIRPGHTGDLTLGEGRSTSDAIAWSSDRDGTYIPTPLVYDGQLYTCNSNGILTAYRASTGERLYRTRVGGGGAFSASPVAADGRLYFASEDGDVFVVRAGPRYEELSRIAMGEVIMATPAISNGLIVIRTQAHVIGIGRPAP